LIRRSFAVNAFPSASGPHRSLVSLPCSQALLFDTPDSTHRCFIGTEFAHVHGKQDGSLHLVLSEADAALVLERGWGELHLMAGQRLRDLSLPNGLIMIYAPRTMDEIVTVLRIVRASWAYAKGDQEPLELSQ
jgi:hypothetical protein